MPRLSWPDLEAVYAVTNFHADGTGSLKITTQKVLGALVLIESDSDAQEDSGMTLVLDDPRIEMGADVDIQFSSPRTSLGRLVDDLGSLIEGPKARVEEPKNYFVKAGRLTAATVPASAEQVRYRSVLGLVDQLRKAAAYLDAVHQHLVFIRDGKIVVPVDYRIGDLTKTDPVQVQALLSQFEGEVHLEQKLGILSEAVIDLIAGVPAGERFRRLLGELPELSSRVSAGYRLFASSFTYSKVRRDVETAQAEFIVRMHKTFVDLQGQILGIPVATIVVATQLKLPTDCGPESWTNIAVVGGAWIFVAFLIASVANQWFTLDAISFEFGRQKERLLKDFNEVSTSFADAFEQLEKRDFWHRFVFVVVVLIAVAAAIFATGVMLSLNARDPLACS